MAGENQESVIDRELALGAGFGGWLFGIVSLMPLGTSTSRIRVSECKSWLCSQFQLPTNAYPVLKDLGPCTKAGDLNGVLGSTWLRPAPALAIVDIWGVDKETEDLSLSFK